MLYEDLRKASPDVAEIYEELYNNFIVSSTGQTLHDFYMDFGICPYFVDSLGHLQHELEHYIVSKLCKDKRFQDLPVKQAYFHDGEDGKKYIYVIDSRMCCGCGKTHSLAVVDTGSAFRLETFLKLPVPLKTIVKPSSVGEVIKNYL